MSIVPRDGSAITTRILEHFQGFGLLTWIAQPYFPSAAAHRLGVRSVPSRRSHRKVLRRSVSHARAHGAPVLGWRSHSRCMPAGRCVRRAPRSHCSSYHAYICVHPGQCRLQETRCPPPMKLRSERHARKVRPAHPNSDSQTLDSSTPTTDSPNAYLHTPVGPLVAYSVRLPRVLVKQSISRS